MSGKLVYIASPYAGDVEQNMRNAREYCKLAVRRGDYPVAPHLLYPQFLDDCVPEERELGLKAGLRLLELCDELWLCGDTISMGMRQELNLAKTLGLPINGPIHLEDSLVLPSPGEAPSTLNPQSVLWESCQYHPASDLDFTGKVMVLRPDMLTDEYRNQENQLVYCEYGFGCGSSRGGRVYGQRLVDGEKCVWRREDFLGALKDESLPGWAKERLQLLRADQKPEDGLLLK